MFSSFPNLRLLLISCPSCRLQGTYLHSHSFRELFLAKEMPLQPVFIVGAFWFTDCFCMLNVQVTASLPSDTQTNSITSNGHVTHCAHPSDKQMETLRGSDLLRLTLQQWWCWGQSTFEDGRTECLLPPSLCGGQNMPSLPGSLHIPACRLASAVKMDENFTAHQSL